MAKQNCCGSSETGKKTVLIPYQLYKPGSEGGGPIRSISNLVSQLGDTFDFKILTSAKNLREAGYNPINYRDEWITVGSAQVRYLLEDECTFVNITKIALCFDYDIVYLNGFFPTKFRLPFLLLHWLNIKEGSPVVVPRGQLYEGAITQKAFKKKFFICASKMLNLYENVIWQSTSNEEYNQIKSHFGTDASIVKAPNLGTVPDVVPSERSTWSSTTPGELRIVFLSRISRKKNLSYALNLLGRVTGKVEFNIYGPIWDEDYWEECRLIIKDLPSSVNVNYHGSVDHNKVFGIFGKHDIFLFPTLGENFGHVIFESLISGCPVLLSNNTPWEDLAQSGAGWSYSLEDEDAFVDCLERCISLSESQYRSLRRSAIELANEYTKNDDAVRQTKQLFKRAL